MAPGPRTPSTPSSWPRRASSRRSRRGTWSCRPPTSTTASWPPSPARHRPRVIVASGGGILGRLTAFAAAFGSAWRVATSGGRPMVVRAQALAFVLLGRPGRRVARLRRHDRGGEPADPARRVRRRAWHPSRRPTRGDAAATRDDAGPWTTLPPRRPSRHRDARAHRVAGGLRRPRDGRTQDGGTDLATRTKTPRPTRTPRAEETPEPSESEEPDGSEDPAAGAAATDRGQRPRLTHGARRR